MADIKLQPTAALNLILSSETSKSNLIFLSETNQILDLINKMKNQIQDISVIAQKAFRFVKETEFNGLANTIISGSYIPSEGDVWNIVGDVDSRFELFIQTGDFVFFTGIYDTSYSAADVKIINGNMYIYGYMCKVFSGTVANKYYAKADADDIFLNKTDFNTAVGSMHHLQTEASNIVGAINEILSNVQTLQSNYGECEALAEQIVAGEV